MDQPDRCQYTIDLSETELNLRTRYQHTYEQSEFRCHRETASCSSYCLFHTSADNNKTEPVSRIFRRYLVGQEVNATGIEPAPSFEPVDRQEKLYRRYNFIGANFGDLDISNCKSLPTETTVPLDLRGATFDTLQFEYSQIKTDLLISGATGGTVDLDNATVTGSIEGDHLTAAKFEAREARVGGDVSLNAVETDGKVGFRNARLAGSLSITDNIDIGEHLSITGASITNEVEVGSGEIAEFIDATHTNIDANVQISNLTVGSVFCNDLEIGALLTIGGDGPEGDVRIDGDLLLTDLEAGDAVQIYGHVDVGGKLELQGAEMGGGGVFDNLTTEQLSLTSVKCRGQLDIVDTTIRSAIKLEDAAFEEGLTLDSVLLSTTSNLPGEEPSRCLRVNASRSYFETLQLSLTSVGSEETRLCRIALDEATVDGGELPQSVAGVDLYYDLTEATVGDVAFRADGSSTRLLDHYFIFETTFDGFDFTARDHREAFRKSWSLHDIPTEVADFVSRDAPDEGSGTEPSNFIARVLCQLFGQPLATPETLSDLESTYLKARQGADQVGDTIAASEFFFLEREYVREYQYCVMIDWIDGNRSTPTGGSANCSPTLANTHRQLGRDWVANTLLKQTCGYGERPLRPVRFSASITVLYAVLYFLIGAFGQQSLYGLATSSNIAPTEIVTTFFRQLAFSLQAFVTLLFSTPSQDSIGLVTRLLAASEGFLGAFMIALFVFTFTRYLQR